MNRNLIRKIVNDRWPGALIYLIGIEAFVLLSAALYPTVKNMKGLDEIIKKTPKSVFKLFGMSSTDFTSFNNYMVGRLLGLVWVIVVAAFVIAFARAMVAGEREEGTLELLLAQPIERWNVLTSEGLVLLAGIIGLVVATVLGTVAFGAAFGAHITFAGYFAFVPAASALFIAIAGYSIFFSAIMRDARRVAMAAAGLTLAFYMMHFAASYSSVADKVDWFGIFHYYDPLKVLNSGNVPVKSFLILLAFGAIGFCAALLVFRHKDIN